MGSATSHKTHQIYSRTVSFGNLSRQVTGSTIKDMGTALMCIRTAIHILDSGRTESAVVMGCIISRILKHDISDSGWVGGVMGKERSYLELTSFPATSSVIRYKSSSGFLDGQLRLIGIFVRRMSPIHLHNGKKSERITLRIV